MIISDQIPGLPASENIDTMNLQCSNCKKIPSATSCLHCFLNLLSLFNSGYFEDENLNVKEQIANIKLDLGNLKPILSIFIQIIEAYSDKIGQLEKKLLELLTNEEIVEDDSSNTEEKNPNNTRKKIPIPGKTSDVAQKIGKFFFNPGFKDGLKLERIHEAAIIELFSMFCESIKGGEYGSSYFIDNVNTGAIKDLNKENPE
jgi:hypothetical protein